MCKDCTYNMCLPKTSRAECGGNMQINLTKAETLALLVFFSRTVKGDCDPVSSRIRMRRSTLARLGLMARVLKGAVE